MAYVVEQKYNDRGKIFTKIYTEQELIDLLPEPPQYNTCIVKNNCDIYYDKFDTLEEAKKFEAQARKA
jgi:N-acetyl-gamma-glutamylphosphate reductase